MITAGDFRNGVTFDMDGQVVTIIEFQHVKPGKGAAFVRTKIKNVITGAVIEKTFNPNDKYPTAFIERKDMEYLYSDGDLYYFMDMESYEQIPINKSVLGDNFKFVKENMECTIPLPTLPSPLHLKPALKSRYRCSSMKATRFRSTPEPANICPEHNFCRQPISAQKIRKRKAVIV